MFIFQRRFRYLLFVYKTVVGEYLGVVLGGISAKYTLRL